MTHAAQPWRYRRTMVAAALSSALLAGTALAGPSSRAEEAFANGQAKATAVVSRVAPGVGSLELAIANGIAVAEVNNSLAQAQSQAIDFGLIGTSLTAEGCDGDATLTPDQLPQPLRVDNRKGDAAATRDEMPLAGGNLGGGRLEVKADKVPSSQAKATEVATAVPPVFSIGGGRAEAVARVIPGQAREARAVVEGDIDIAGVIQMRGMRWTALHRTGKDAKAQGSFEIGSASMGSFPLPAEAGGPLQSLVNTALAPSGISVEFPRVERLQSPSDLVRVTPMRIVLKDSPLGKTVLGPGLTLTRAQREQLFNQLVAVYCDFASLLLVGDIAVSIASGTGFLALEFGGAEATTSDIEAGNPFGSGGTRNVALDSDAPLPAQFAEFVAGQGFAAPPADGSAPAPRPERALGATGPVREVCESVHPFDWPGCSSGAAAAVGMLGLLATIGVGALDWRHQRGRRMRGSTTIAS